MAEVHRYYRKGQLDLDDMAAGARHVGLHRHLNGTVSIVKHNSSITLIEPAIGEGPADLLEHDGGGGGGVVDDGDLVHVVGVNQVLDYGTGAEDGGFEVVEVEGVGVSEVFELIFVLGGEDGFGAGSEAAVVDPGDVRVVVREFGSDLGGGD